MLDGDEVRTRLTKDLGFSKEGRDENIRRISYVAKLITRVGGVALTAAISPYKQLRAEAREEIQDFIEIYVNCPIEVCIRRDVKGHYAKAQRGEIQPFTGISDPYEPTGNPDVIVHTDQETPNESIGKVLEKLTERKYLPRGRIHMEVGFSSTIDDLQRACLSGEKDCEGYTVFAS